MRFYDALSELVFVCYSRFLSWGNNEEEKKTTRICMLEKGKKKKVWQMRINTVSNFICDEIKQNESEVGRVDSFILLFNIGREKNWRKLYDGNRYWFHIKKKFHLSQTMVPSNLCWTSVCRLNIILTTCNRFQVLFHFTNVKTEHYIDQCI